MDISLDFFEMLVVVLAMLVLIGGAVYAALLIGRHEQVYAPKALLTDNEKEFYARLSKALPRYRIFAQVALGAILQPAMSPDNRKEYYKIRGTFAAKIADYVVLNDNLDVLAVIELDDMTHDLEKDRIRDAMLAEAGYRVIRFHSRQKPSEAEIRAVFA